MRKVFSTIPSLSLNILNFPIAKGLVKIFSLLICLIILETSCSLLDFVLKEVILGVNVLGVVMEHWILREFDTTLIVMVGHNMLQYLTSLASQLAVLVAMYSLY